MNAKDTVAHKPGCIAKAYVTVGGKKIYYDCTCGMEAQAEISFKAGMRLVADWFVNNLEPTVPMTLDYKKMHKQLKEWGL